ncbi:MAG: FGGY-family carbohydrate kinase [Candidatus Lokiarchaeota archaeon]
MKKYILTHDLGTTGNKAALFDDKLNLIHKTKFDYPIFYPKKGWAEQDAEDYWNSVIQSTKVLLDEKNIEPSDIQGLIFDCQMNCTIPIDEQGKPLMRAISWLDTRAANVTKKFRKGLIKVSGFGIGNLLRFIKITGGAPGINGKDPISHILWLKEHKSELYQSAFKFLSVKDFIVFRCTGNAITSRDLANTSWLMNTSPEILNWSKKLLSRLDIDINKLPEIKMSTEIAGGLKKDAADILGLNEDIPVIVGSGDISAAAIGSGAITENQIHINLGTADWIAAHVSERKKDLIHYMGSICSAKEMYLCLSKQETGAACLDWFKNQTFQKEIEEFGKESDEIYSLLDSVVKNTNAGAKNLIFTPWLYGERSPLNDSNVRGGFYNLSLDHTRSEMLRSIYEGVALNLKWGMQYLEKLAGKSENVNLIGGGANSDVWCQILADILNRNINKVEEPHLGSAKGSAIIAMVGLGILKDFHEAIPLIKVEKIFQPNKDNRKIYDLLYNEYVKIYKRNKKMFDILNS